MNEVSILGIDLGTTNSAIAIWDPETGRSRVLRNQEGDRLTPSVVTFDPETGKCVVGRTAIARMVTRPSEVVYSVKRFIGRTFRDEWVSYDQQHVTYSIEEAPKRKVVVRVKERILTPPQVSSEILRKLKEDAEVLLGGKKITRAIVTVPAYFDESQRQATREAAKLAGLRVPRIINEPTASALAFGLGSEPQTVVVYDLGGGTFDISILRIDHGLFRVKATSGDTHLGGDDFDMAIALWIKEEFEHEHGVSLPVENNRNLQAVLRMEAERAKIALTTTNECTIYMPDLVVIDEQSLDLDVILTRSEFEELIQPYIKRSLEICDSVLEQAGISADQIDQALLVGGQTRTPAIKNAIHERYGWALNDSINPEEAVAQGAALLGARLCGYLKGQVALWDVNPLSLGLELANGEMYTIIEANAQIPVTVWRKGSEAFTTQRDGQERIRFRIFQGERPIATDNVLLGEVVLNLATTRPAGEPRINCMFKVDHDGILHVQAEDADTEGEPVEATFDHVYRMTPEEVDAIREEVQVHKDEDTVTRQLFRLEEELVRIRQIASEDRPIGDPLLEHLNDLESAISARNVDRAEDLLGEIKQII